MKSDKARFVATLDAGAHFLLADVAGLHWGSVSDCRWGEGGRGRELTSLHRDLGTNSIPSTGSIYAGFASLTSGIQIAQRRWLHLVVVVCLNAPSVFGQKIQCCFPAPGHDQHPPSITNKSKKPTAVCLGIVKHFRHNHCPSGIYGTP